MCASAMQPLVCHNTLWTWQVHWTLLPRYCVLHHLYNPSLLALLLPPLSPPSTPPPIPVPPSLPSLPSLSSLLLTPPIPPPCTFTSHPSLHLPPSSLVNSSPVDSLWKKLTLSWWVPKELQRVEESSTKYFCAKIRFNAEDKQYARMAVLTLLSFLHIPVYVYQANA